MPKPIKTAHIRYACWGLLPGHVRKLRPAWTEQEALNWLFNHQYVIAKTIERIGWQYVAELLDEEDEQHGK